MIANVNIDKDLTIRYEFNIKTLLLDMENILKKYIQMPDGLTYVKGLAEPVYDKLLLSRYKDNNIKLYDVPQCPVIAPSVVKELLELHLVESCADSELLYINRVLDKVSPIYAVSKKHNYTDIFMDVLPIVNDRYVAMYTNEDITELLNIVTKITNKFNTLINNDFKSIYSIDVSKETFVVYKYMTIGEYRYSECEYIKKIEMEYEDDLHGITHCHS